MGPEQWLFLQWHEHKGSLVSMFEKLFERNTFVDCTLAAEGQYLNVHKVILSACSPYFELLLNENRDKHPIIILKDVKFRSLKSIIEYMYRGEANVLSSDIKDFLAAAESLQIKGIGKHGGDTKNQPKKALQDFVEGEGRSPHSPKIYPGSGDNDKRTVTDFHEIKSDDEDDESGRDKNFCYIENVEHHSNISPQKIPVPIITSETNAETQWLKAESPEDTAQYLMSMPTLNIGACTTDIVHPGLKETVPERTANKISTQNVLPCDVQMKKAEMSRSETKCELQPASPIVDNEVADSASQASSVRELSDTAEEWAEEEMEEALTHSHTTGNSVVGGTDESRAHFDGGSDATRESRDLGSDQQEFPVDPENVAGERNTEIDTKLVFETLCKENDLEATITSCSTLEELCGTILTPLIINTERINTIRHKKPAEQPHTSELPIDQKSAALPALASKQSVPKTPLLSNSQKSQGKPLNSVGQKTTDKKKPPTEAIKSRKTQNIQEASGDTECRSKSKQSVKTHKAFPFRKQIKRHGQRHKVVTKYTDEQKAKDIRLLEKIQKILQAFPLKVDSKKCSLPIREGIKEKISGIVPPSKTNGATKPTRRRSASDIRTSTQNRHVCPYCFESFPILGLLKKHIRRHKSADKVTQDTVKTKVPQPPPLLHQIKAEEIQARGEHEKECVTKKVKKVPKKPPSEPKQKEKKTKKTKESNREKETTAKETSASLKPDFLLLRGRPWVCNKLFQCSQCSYGTSLPRAFIQHLLSHLKEEDGENDNDSDFTNGESKSELTFEKSSSSSCDDSDFN